MRLLASLSAAAFGIGATATLAAVNEQGYEIAPATIAKGTSEEIEKGKSLYAEWCSQCHGETGDGAGIMAERLHPRPRDFTAGVYKLRHTFAGETPTDEDLFETISHGMPGSSMPGWAEALTAEEIRSLVAYLKTLSPPFEKFPAEEKLVVGKPLQSSSESLARGREVYAQMQCAKCHGEKGRGNGPSANELKDDFGHKIWPADLTQAWTFRGGAETEEVYRTLVTGLTGTPMPSYAASVTSEDAWHLANYVSSLSRTPVREVVVRGAKVPSIPDDPGAGEWQNAPGVDFKLAGQIVEDPRLFTPTTTEVNVKALYDGSEVGLLLSWNDRTEDSGEAAALKDAAAIQFPSERLAEEKPYFLMGDARHPVDYWLWSAGSSSVTHLLAHGMDDVTTKDALFRARGIYDDGSYHVLYRRSLAAERELEVQFEPGAFIPIAFHLWDGANGEEGKRRAISAWYYLLLEPETPKTLFAWPLGAVFVGAGAQMLLLRRLKRAEKVPSSKSR